jgi:hypothetical protein
VVIDQRSYPRDEAKFTGVVIEAIPEDFFRGVCCESWKTIAASRGDEVNLIVD